MTHSKQHKLLLQSVCDGNKRKQAELMSHQLNDLNRNVCRCHKQNTRHEKACNSDFFFCQITCRETFVCFYSFLAFNEPNRIAHS